jgi:AcrR family transcriptional regulator
VPRKSRHRLGVDERRAQLIELGRRMFLEKPFDEISIDDIAHEAGVSKGLLYHYFQSKRRFYVETLRAAMEEMRVLTEPDPTLPPLERLDASLDAYLAYVEKLGPGYTKLMQSGVGVDAEVQALIEQQRELVIGRVTHALAIDEPPAPIRMALRAWLGFIDAACLDWVEHGDVPRRAVRALLANSLQSALLTAVQMDPTMNVVLPQLHEDESATEAAARIALAIAEANGPSGH